MSYIIRVYAHACSKVLLAVYTCQGEDVITTCPAIVILILAELSR